MLDFFLACVRKEPHLGSLLTFVSDCDAPVSPAVRQNLRAICNYTSFPNPVKSLEWIILPLYPQPCGRCAKVLAGSVWKL